MSILQIFGDYHGSSLSGDCTAREHILDDSDWSALKANVETFGAPDSGKIHGLRVIDVEEARITIAPSNCQYITLSYVWGASEEARNSLKATSGNIRSLEAFGSLRSNTVPATIKDAMTACAKLGKRYLWVDRLCILQDDPGSMINVMDQIYTVSILTIVPFSNNDVSQKIPGISRPQMMPLEVRVPNWLFLEKVSGYDQRLSHWRRRGWTFQEEHFSMQLLFFGEREHYSCKNTESSSNFFQLVTDYSHRNLSLPGDKVRAFAGVLNRQYGRNHRDGMPFPEFDYAMLWRPNDPSKNEVFPSWSWASVRSVQYDSYYEDKLAIASWAFYTRTSTFDIQLIPVIPKPEKLVWKLPTKARFKNRRDEYARRASVLLISSILAWREGFFVPRMPIDFTLGLTWYEIMLKAMSRWSEYEDFWRATRPHDLHRLLVEKVAQTALDGETSPRTVLVHTQSAVLYLRIPVECKIPLFTPEDVLCGWAVLDREAEDYKRLHSAEDGEPKVEVLALSITRETCRDKLAYEGICGIYRPEGIYDDKRHEDVLCFDSEGRVIDTFRPPMMLINVMLLEKLGGSYRRIGLGKVLMKRWNSARPQFGVFVLE
ncbi:Heterokaryon incompatibility [Macrophomina phaseolina MS6]|uniref:Heterokaryon incompatibility n=1 Tax=Macrophomina phaseolina (strain MS6) TaxID=1126212 RepID=K2RIH8_MACPH|nr:Heterokaryon incompatibility [Macrophomina phaseolina MS6]